MPDLTLIIPAKHEVESLPVFLEEIKNYKCKKFIVLQKEDLETKNAIKKIKNIKIGANNHKKICNSLFLKSLLI